MAGRNAVVALTDQRWYEFLRGLAAGGRLDEVNFWRPLAQTEFRSLSPGEPFFFRLKHPLNAIAGYGFFALNRFLGEEVLLADLTCPARARTSRTCGRARAARTTTGR